MNIFLCVLLFHRPPHDTLSHYYNRNRHLNHKIDLHWWMTNMPERRLQSVDIISCWMCFSILQLRSNLLCFSHFWIAYYLYDVSTMSATVSCLSANHTNKYAFVFVLRKLSKWMEILILLRFSYNQFWYSLKSARNWMHFIWVNTIIGVTVIGVVLS